MKSSAATVARLMRVGSLGLVLLGALVPGISLAAEAGKIPEIIVTVERREANLQSVPVAVSALDASTLDNRQITDYQDLRPGEALGRHHARRASSFRCV